MSGELGSPSEDRFCEKHGYSYAGETCPSCDRYEQGGLHVLGFCPHGVNLDREFCSEGCRV